MSDDKNKKQGEETREEIKENGQLILDKNRKKNHIQLITIIGEIEGHDNLGSNSKTTKYEHILPALGYFMICLECTVGFYVVWRSYKSILKRYS